MHSQTMLGSTSRWRPPRCPADYIGKGISAYLEALYLVNIRHLDNVTIRDFPKTRFFQLLRNAEFVSDLLKRTEPYPYFHYQLDRFAQLCQTPNELLRTLQSHEMKVVRQIKRIYRARNVIVH